MPGKIFFLAQYVPCYCRQQVTSSIYRWKEEAFQEEGKQRNLVLITNEDLSYEIYITDEPNRSKIHGPGWEKLISDYDLHYRDLIIINLDTGSLSIEIDLRLSDSRGGHRPLPKPSLGKCTNFHPVLSTMFISILWCSYPCPLNECHGYSKSYFENILCNSVDYHPNLITCIEFNHSF